jgi:hypothetical protein
VSEKEEGVCALVNVPMRMLYCLQSNDTHAQFVWEQRGAWRWMREGKENSAHTIKKLFQKCMKNSAFLHFAVVA